MRMIRLYIFIVGLAVLSACQDQNYWVVDFPEFETSDKLILQSTSLPVDKRIAIEGIYKVVKGSSEFGDTIVVKVTRDRISFFGNKQGIFSIVETGIYSQSILLEGYWRQILTDKTGLIRLFVDQSTSILNDIPTSVITITGLYSFNSGEPNNQIQFERIESFTETLLNDKFLIVAHRGGGRNSDFHPYSENSIEMINYSEYLGATGVEIDVYITKDDVPVVYHDAELNVRSIQKSPLMGKIADYTYSQLRTYVKLLHGEEIPKLDDALKFILEETSLRLVWLDIKDFKTIDNAIILQKKYNDKITGSGRDLSVYIGIPDENTYNYVLSKPDYDRIATLCELDTDKVIAANSKIWAPPFSNGYQSDKVIEMHNNGVLCIPWTVDYPKHIALYTSYGSSTENNRFDGILTDYPTILAYYHYVRHND